MSKDAVKVNLNDLETCYITITGMSCASCIGKIEESLMKEPGITSVQIALLTEKAEVQYNPEYLIHSPETKLLYLGRWHDGLIPFESLNQEELLEIEKFNDSQYLEKKNELKKEVMKHKNMSQ